MNADNNVNSELDMVLAKYANLDMFEGYKIISPDSQGPDGDTPFHMVAYDGDVDAAKLMFPYVLNINMKGDNGNSPLHYAVSHKKLEMVKFLVFCGADVHVKNDFGDTPLEDMELDNLFSVFLMDLRREKLI